MTGIPLHRAMASDFSVVWKFSGLEQLLFRYGSNSTPKNNQRFFTWLHGLGCERGIFWLSVYFSVTLRQRATLPPWTFYSIGYLVRRCPLLEYSARHRGGEIGFFAFVGTVFVGKNLDTHFSVRLRKTKRWKRLLDNCDSSRNLFYLYLRTRVNLKSTVYLLRKKRGSQLLFEQALL
jgi:hypothetical protein